MIFNTTGLVAPLASTPAVNPAPAPSAEAADSARASRFELQQNIPAQTAALLPEKPVARANETGGSSTLFLAQLFGNEDGQDITQSNLVEADRAYRAPLTSAQRYSPVLSPEQLQEFSDVKYKPGLRPPEPTAGRLSLVA